MLAYTFRSSSGIINATYSGRFAFSYLSDYEDYLKLIKLRKGDNFRGLWKKEVKGEYSEQIRIIAHEYTHKHIFSLSKAGLLLNGWRFLARAIFLFSHSEKALEKYYKARTIFFQETSDYHEKLADLIDEKLSNSEQDIEVVLQKLLASGYSEIIEAADKKIFESWEPDLMPHCLWRKPYIALGRWLHQSFGLYYSYCDKDGKQKQDFIVDDGIANDTGLIRQGDSDIALFKKHLLENYIIQPLGNLNSYQLRCEWFRISQKAQCSTLQEKYDYSLEKYKSTVLLPFSFYIMNWAGIPIESQTILLNISVDALTLDRDFFYEKWGDTLEKHEKTSGFGKYFWFIHQYGN